MSWRVSAYSTSPNEPFRWVRNAVTKDIAEPCRAIRPPEMPRTLCPRIKARVIFFIPALPRGGQSMPHEYGARVILEVVHYQGGGVSLCSFGPLGEKDAPAPGIYRGFVHQTDECVMGNPVQHGVRAKA